MEEKEHRNRTTYKDINIRDFFAGQAIAAGFPTSYLHSHDFVATWAYQRADAILRERIK